MVGGVSKFSFFAFLALETFFEEVFLMASTGASGRAFGTGAAATLLATKAVVGATGLASSEKPMIPPGTTG